MRTFILALLGIVAACGTAPASPPAEQIAVVDAEHDALHVGDAHRYAFSWRVESSASNGLLGELPSSGGLELAGELELHVLAQTDAGTTIAARFTRLDRHRIETFGQDVLADASVLLGRRALVVVPDGGDVRRVLFDSESPSVFRHVMGGLLAHVDLHRPPHDGWRGVVPTGNGLADVAYERAADGSFARRIDRYRRVDAIAGLGLADTWHSDGQATLELGDRGMPRRVASTELLTLPPSELGVRFDGETQVSLERVAVEHREPDPPASIEDWTEDDLHAPPDDREAQQELARRFAEGMTMTDLTIAVQSAGRGLRPSAGFHVRARGLLRGWPELAADVAPLFDEAPDHRTRAFVLDLLVSADTPEAQGVVIGLLDRTPRADDLAALTQHLGLVRTPTPALVQTLLDLHTDAIEDGDATLRQALLYPLGSMVASVGTRDPVLAEVAMQRLRGALAEATSSEDRMAAIAGLGNAGFAGDAPLVLAMARDASADVRTETMTALRFFPGEGIDDALFGALADRDRIVAAAALAVIEGYRADERRIARLAAQVARGDHHAELGGALVSVLAKHGLERDDAREALAKLGERSSDPREQVRIRRILGDA